MAGLSRTTLAAIGGLLAGLGVARADDQTQPGAGNPAAARIAAESPLIRSALVRLHDALDNVGDAGLRGATEDALFNRETCVKHRVNLDHAKKQAIVAQLLAAGLLNAGDDTTFPGGLVAGVFPPVHLDGTACPHLPQPFYAASGGGAHHAYPGGIAVHEAFNLRSDLSFAANYRRAYGFTGADGLPRIGPIGPADIAQKPDITISNDLIVAAPMWHDWAKAIVFQWNADGTQFKELSIGGTGGHHILGLAETIKRGLSPELVITQAAAHAAPNPGNEPNVVGWLRAAAIIAGVDPVAYGILTVASDGKMHLPPVRRLGEVDLVQGGQDNLLVEYALHNLSDADFTETVPAVGQSDLILGQLAGDYGYSAAVDLPRYTTHFLNAVLANLGAEHVQIVFANQGLSGVARELDKLHAKRVF